MCGIPSITYDSQVQAWGSISLGTIPSGYRPAVDTGDHPVPRQTSTSHVPFFLFAGSAGALMYRLQGGAATPGTIMKSSYMWVAD